MIGNLAKGLLPTEKKPHFNVRHCDEIPNVTLNEETKPEAKAKMTTAEKINIFMVSSKMIQLPLCVCLVPQPTINLSRIILFILSIVFKVVFADIDVT